MADHVDFTAALDQRREEMRSLAELFGTYRQALIDQGFAVPVADDMAAYYASVFLDHGFAPDDD